MNASDHLYQEKHSPHIPVFPFSLTTSKAPRWALYPNTHPWSHCLPQGISIVTHGTQQKQWCVTPVSVSQVTLLGAACWKVVSSLSVRDKLYDHAPGVTSETDPPVPDRHTGEIVPDGGPEWGPTLNPFQFSETTYLNVYCLKVLSFEVISYTLTNM